MITLRPDIQQAHARVAILGLGALGTWGMRRGRRGSAWLWREGGATALLVWSGERLPLPTVTVRTGKRWAAVVGFAPGVRSPIDTLLDEADFADGVYHFAVVTIGAGGLPCELHPIEIQTRVIDGGSVVGLMPNAPSLVQARRLPGRQPRVEWAYSRFGEQTPPAAFEVYAVDEEDPWDFGSPVGEVSFEQDRTRYGWTGAALNVGDVRHYTVRAVSASGVKSLIPRAGQSPSPDYRDVAKTRAAWLEIPAPAPADPGTPMIEVLA